MLRELAASRTGRAVLGALAILIAAVALGLVLLWPDGSSALPPGSVVQSERAQVERVDRRACPLSQRAPCQVLTIRLVSGPERGITAPLTLAGTDAGPAVKRGDTIRVVANEVPDQEGGELPPGVELFSFSDFERRTPLYALALLFAIVVIAFSRWKGVRALVGLALSLLIVTQFIVPAILAGSAPLPVALVGALAVMLVTVTLAHGTGVTSIAAILGAAASLLATAPLALLFVELAQITGFSSEEARLLQGYVGGSGVRLSLEGLVLAGIVVATLGVLDDVTVSQASTVLALHRAAPAQGMRRLVGGAIRVGRDHLAATVNTLVLAYVGTALRCPSACRSGRRDRARTPSRSSPCGCRRASPAAFHHRFGRAGRASLARRSSPSSSPHGSLNTTNGITGRRRRLTVRTRPLPRQAMRQSRHVGSARTDRAGCAASGPGASRRRPRTA